MGSRKVVVLGGGAAGFFFAINYKRQNPNDDIVIYEQGKNFLSKVKVSGGGRCNVTHACFDPGELIQYYPRGGRELLGPFHRFACGDTVAWFEERGVALKIESDGRMFPESDRSGTIIDCFMKEVRSLEIRVMNQSRVEILSLKEKIIEVNREQKIQPDLLFIATGSSKHMWKTLKANGVDIVDPVPSLFTFNIDDLRIKGLAGISFDQVEVVSEIDSYRSDGPLLITHWGFSAPSILKLSSVEARVLSLMRYKFHINIDFLPGMNEDELKLIIQNQGGRKIGEKNPFGIPRRYWQRMIEVCAFDPGKRWADLKKEELMKLVVELKKASFKVKGKSTFKEEFVSAGGIDLKEIDFKNFGLKKFPGVYAAGEVLNIDAMTGGFNFQSAWTGSYLAAMNANIGS